MDDKIQPSGLFFDALSALGFEKLIGGPETLRQGLLELEAEMLRVATDACVAEMRGAHLSDAACDFDTYPMLARFHTAVDDFLFDTLPPELLRWTENMFENPQPAIFDELGSQLVGLAAREPNHVRRTMYRVLLFEWIRLGLVIQYHLEGGASEVGIQPEDLSVIAEEKIQQWLADPPALADGDRPVHILFAAAVGGTEQFASELQAVVGALQSDFVEQLRWRARLHRELAKFDRRDALLVRNAMAATSADSADTGYEERPLSVEHLQSRHPLILGGIDRNTLDQRLRRFRRTLRIRDIHGLRRRGKAIIDIVAEYVSDTKRRA